MSYILEALADSEQARQQVAAAPRHSLLQAVGEDSPRQRVWPYALAGALLLNVALLSLWQRPAPPEYAAPVKVPPQAAPAVPQAAATAAPEARVAPSAESAKPAVTVAEIVLRETRLPPQGRAEERGSARLAAAADAIAGSASAKSANDNAPVTMLKLSAPKTKATPGAEPAVAKAATPAAPELPLAPSARGSAVAPAAPAAASTALAPAAAPAQPAPAAADETELPPALLKEMPALSVHGVIHGEGSSMVIVNNRLVREGDEVAPGVKLERIIGDNLVFNYKGYRFRR